MRYWNFNSLLTVRWALVFVVVAGSFLLLNYLNKRYQHGGSISVVAANAWLVIIGLGLSCLGIYLGFRALAWLWRSPFGSWNVFGDSPVVRLLALGATAIVYPKALYAILATPILAAIEFASVLPKLVEQSIGTKVIVRRVPFLPETGAV